MSIAMFNEVQALKARVAALEELVRTLAAQQITQPQSTLRLKPERAHG